MKKIGLESLYYKENSSVLLHNQYVQTVINTFNKSHKLHWRKGNMDFTFYLLKSTMKPGVVLWWNDFQIYGCPNCILCQNIHIYRSYSSVCIYTYRALYTHIYLHVERNIYVHCVTDTGEKLMFALVSEREELPSVQEYSLLKCLSCVSTDRVISVSHWLRVLVSLHLFIRCKN